MNGGRVALMTGGSRGLGRVMALAMLEDGHDVVLSGTDEEALREVKAEAEGLPGRAEYVAMDLSVPGGAERLAEEAVKVFGRIDILANNAGMSLANVRGDYLTNPYRFWESDRAIIEKTFQLNTISPMILAGLLAPAMIERGWGRIFSNTTSLDTMLRFNLYGGSKSGLEAETAVMAKDLDGTGVTANVLVPGGGAVSRMAVLSGIAPHLLIPAEVMGPPAKFLASDLSNNFTARRILAVRWDTNLPPQEAAQKASDVIAWTGYGILGVQPEIAREKPRPVQ